MKETVRKGLGIYSQLGASNFLNRFLGKIVPNNLFHEKRADYEYSNRNLPTHRTHTAGDDHIILIVVDSLRCDVINAHDTPLLNEFDKTTAVAPSPWTYPSVSSILTGLYPHQHGAIRQNDDPDNVGVDEIYLPPKSTEHTLPEHFASVGYNTYGAFGFLMPFLAASGRFETHKLYNDAGAERILTNYETWLDNNITNSTFSYIHLADPHQPTDPPEKYWREYRVDDDLDGITKWGDYADNWDGKGAEYFQEHKKRLYRASVNYVDSQISKLIGRLGGKLHTDPTVIVTSDHGEALWEHPELDSANFYDSRPAYSVGHGGTPYESISRVPILYKNTEFSSEDCSTIDIFPTLLSDKSIDIPDGVTGHSHSDPFPAQRMLLTEGSRYGYEKKAIYDSDYKMIRSNGDDTTLGFEIPSETTVQLPDGVESELTQQLPPWPEGDKVREVSNQVQTQLENLGYK
ncbi:sulfatase-like hydrolase/transferase [Haloarcula sp. NS06]|uniref:sulfatase-like hydrolase/transferase n=1 Tax=Haloarcula sp. NS06 TaxID=3409688 RepID=UPI003DA6E2DC